VTVYAIVLTRRAKRALDADLPESVAAACYEFIHSELAQNPFRVGKPLKPPFDPAWVARRGEYRVIYTINNKIVTVTVLTIEHRRDAYHRSN
jgi:mRNA interferase RelE/StbE